jgi:hypothetical protein
MTAVDPEIRARATTYKSFLSTRIHVFFFELCDKKSTMKEKKIQMVVTALCFADVT